MWQRCQQQKSDVAVLHRLLSGTKIHLGTLAESLGKTVVALQEDLDQLKAAGCDLEYDSPYTCRLLRTHLSVWANYLQSRHRGERARHLEVFDAVTSTQDVLRRLVDTTGLAADGAVAVADYQTAGRGRLGRQWLAPPGTALLFSRAHVDERPLTVDQLMLSAVIAIAAAVEKVASRHRLEVRIRWPNDLMVNGRKLAGILVEQFKPRTGPSVATVVGIGINTTLTPDAIGDPQIRDSVTSLKMCGCQTDRLVLCAAALEQLDGTLASADTSQLIDEWRARSEILCQRVSLRHNGRVINGHVIDLDPREGLIVRTDSGVITHLPGASTCLNTSGQIGSRG